MGQFAVAALEGKHCLPERRVGEGSALPRERAALPYQRRRSQTAATEDVAAASRRLFSAKLFQTMNLGLFDLPSFPNPLFSTT